MGENNVKGWRGEEGPSMERLSSSSDGGLGWQWVVVAFAALALTAEDNGSGQKEEGRGNQQKEAEASKDPYDLQENTSHQFISMSQTVNFYQWIYA